MNKIFRVVLSALVTLAVAVFAALALSAPANAMTVAANTNTNPSTQVVKVTLSDADINGIKAGYAWAKALCTDTSNAVIPSSSSWFNWDAPTPGPVGVDRCANDLYFCVQGGGRSVTFVNYAAALGWSYWKDTCHFS